MNPAPALELAEGHSVLASSVFGEPPGISALFGMDSARSSDFLTRRNLIRDWLELSFDEKYSDLSRYIESGLNGKPCCLAVGCRCGNSLSYVSYWRIIPPELHGPAKSYFIYSVTSVLGKIRADRIARTLPRAAHLIVAVQSIVEGAGGLHLCLKSISLGLHVSPGHLAAMFSSILGISYRDYAKSVRFAFAAASLANGGVRVSDVALLLGYTQPSNFVRDFRSGFQLCPARWKKAYADQMSSGLAE